MGGEYWFQVQAINSVGASAWSGKSRNKTVDIPPDPPAAPGKPGGLVVVAGDKTLTVSWQTPASRGSAVSSYDVDISPEPSQGRGNVRGWTTTTVKWDGNLKNGTTYTIQVRANNKGAQSDWTKTTGIPVGAPGSFQVSWVQRVDAGDFKVSWTAADANGAVKAGGGVTYAVLLKGGEYGGGKAAATGITGTSQEVPAASPGVTYTVWVVATGKANGLKQDTSSDNSILKEQWGAVSRPTDLVGSGSCSDPTDATEPHAATDPMASPTCKVQPAEGTVTASWSLSADDQAGYVKVKPWLETSGGSLKPPDQGGSSANASFSGLTGGAYKMGVYVCVNPGALAGYQATAVGGNPADVDPDKVLCDTNSSTETTGDQVASTTVSTYTLPTSISQPETARDNTGTTPQLDVTYTSPNDNGGSGISVLWAAVQDPALGQTAPDPTWVLTQTVGNGSITDPDPAAGYTLYLRTCNAVGCAGYGTNSGITTVSKHVDAP
jgi:hypothetical protein